MSTQFLISTVSTNVTISDLGLVLTHPVVDRDLALEFAAEEIAASEDLTAAIQGGSLTVKITTSEYGEYQIDADEYTSFSLLEQALPSFEKEEFLTESEIEATYLDSFIREGVFPFTLSSTTAVTNVVVATGATFQDWRVAPNDVIGIFGTTTSDGYFTVQSVTNQTTLVTEEALNTTSGVGTFAIYNPVGAKRVGVDNTNFTTIGGTDAQAVFESIDLNMVQDLDDLGDVDVSTNPPLDGYVLAYNSGAMEWQPAEVGGGAGGQANTASNVGVGGVGLFKQKVGADLQFKNINAGSNKIIVVDDTGNDEVDIDVDDGYIVHQNLIGAGTYTHAQIDAHIDDFDNPHNVTAIQVGRDTAQWNANQLQGIPVSPDDPLDGYILEYDGYQWAPVSVTSLIEDEHRGLDQLVHEIAEDAYTEYTYSGNQVTNIIAYTNSGKTIKIREEQFTYSGTRVDTAVTIQYDGAGTMVERLTETFTYSGTQVVSVDSVLEEF